MAKKNQDQDWDANFKRPQLNLKTDARRGVAVVLFCVLAVLIILGLIGSAGSFGTILNKILRLAFGWMAFGVPAIFLLVAAALLRQPKDEEKNTVSTHAYVGGVLLMLSLTNFLHLLVIRKDLNTAFDMVQQGTGGGYLGLLISYPLMHVMGFAATLVVMIAGILISFIVTFNFSILDLFRRKPKELARKNNSLRINSGVPEGFSREPISELNKAVTRDPLEPVINNFPELKPSSKKLQIAKVEDKDWKFPSLDLLDESKTRVDSGNIEANVAIIQKTLNDFGIEVEMGEVNVGPTVTQYTLRPAVGVKLSQIAALQNDLALALAAHSIRMELPIPGKALVGVEIPNKSSANVRIREIIGSNIFNEHPSKLTFTLGRDVAGHPMISDLSRMPHLLIAGATGTGKSVCINSLLISFLYRATPSEIKLIVIDPKRVELSLYNGLPHLLTPVITDHQKAVNALKWTVAEMDRRYKLLSEVHKRNIAEYNQAALIRLPYIIVVVDELADLMSLAQNEVEATIVRLAQMARAVGIHLVVATQRPSVDVITGLIKANITARIAFAVASQVDSRTILDISGAEKLLGSGDMLYITAELPKPKRVQGAYVTEKEIKRVTDFIRKQSDEVVYNEEILEKPNRNTSVGGFDDQFDDEDDLVNDAIGVVRAAGKASSSLLQRRLRIGYARAARLLDILEDKGIVGPGEGAKPREVYGMSSQEDEENLNE
ncbi:MAG: DNA translocase FtsK 4TM domain-containing protein [Candidatus Doudnabacteria bacterium]|nr:DNA translocase FtsK 4TM domain-containing protein [Candidatus Doudnabacteria bacterium]